MRRGTNADSLPDIIFMGGAPLSELVWSPHTGLSIIRADCSSERTSTLQRMESTNIVLSSTQNIKVRESNNIKITIEGNLSSMDLATNSDKELSDRVVAAISPRSMVGTPVPDCQLRNNQEDTSSCRNMKDLTVDTDSDHGRSMPSKSMGLCLSSEVHADSDLIKVQNDPIATSSGVPSIPDLSEVRNFKNLSRNEEAPDPGYIVEGHAEGKPNKGSKSILILESEDIHSQGDFASKGVDGINSELKHSKISTSTFMNVKPTEHGLFVEKENENNFRGLIKSTLHGSIPVPGTSSQPIKEEIVFHQHTLNASQTNCGNPYDKRDAGKEDYPAKDEIKGNQDHNQGTLKWDKVANEGFPQTLDQRKGKGKIFSGLEIDEEMSKEGSHESVESSNSRGMFSHEKRVWGFEREQIDRSKRIKKDSHENDITGSAAKYDSSFITWMSGMVKRGLEFDVDEKRSLMLTLDSNLTQGDKNLLLKSQVHNKKDPCCQSQGGFGTIFRALYSQNLSSHLGGKDEIPNQQKRLECFQRLELSQKSLGIDKKVGNSTPNTSSPLANKAKDYIICGDGPSTLPSTSCPRVGIIHENPTAEIGDQTLNQKTNKNDFLDDIWVTRYCPKPPIPMFSSVQDDHFKIPGVSLDKQMDDVNKESQKGYVSSAVSCDSMRSSIPTYQKMKSKLNPIQPSQRLKDSEVIASVFARRLDALRHIVPSMVSENQKQETSNTICFFCGVRGHSLRDCSEIIESDLKDLLENSKCDNQNELSCFCIRCFRLNHWAISCPYATSNQTNFGVRKHTSFSIHDRTDLGQFAGSTIQCQNASLDESNLKPIKADYSEVEGVRMPTQITPKEKKPASVFTEMSGGNNIVPYSTTFIDHMVPLVPRGTFEIIRQLQLSRADILRWMKFPNPCLSIQGFFLRLKLGKWGKGLGGTGYHVAHINGIRQGNSSTSCEKLLSVSIGDLICIVDCRYVSNHSFIENELMAWWCSTLKIDGKIPSGEELKIKLEEKAKHGF